MKKILLDVNKKLFTLSTDEKVSKNNQEESEEEEEVRHNNDIERLMNRKFISNDNSPQKRPITNKESNKNERLIKILNNNDVKSEKERGNIIKSSEQNDIIVEENKKEVFTLNIDNNEMNTPPSKCDQNQNIEIDEEIVFIEETRAVCKSKQTHPLPFPIDEDDKRSLAFIIKKKLFLSF
jgi:hypothetical protein